jgi:hypothetical protein
MQKYKKNHIWKKYSNRLFCHGSNQMPWSSMYNFVWNIIDKQERERKKPKRMT